MKQLEGWVEGRGQRAEMASGSAHLGPRSLYAERENRRGRRKASLEMPRNKLRIPTQKVSPAKVSVLACIYGTAFNPIQLN